MSYNWEDDNLKNKKYRGVKRSKQEDNSFNIEYRESEMILGGYGGQFDTCIGCSGEMGAGLILQPRQR